MSYFCQHERFEIRLTLMAMTELTHKSTAQAISWLLPASKNSYFISSKSAFFSKTSALLVLLVLLWDYRYNFKKWTPTNNS